VLIDQPGKFLTEHTGQFVQGYAEGFNSTAGIPKDYKAGYQYGTNDWNQHGPGGNWDQDHVTPYHFECPLPSKDWHSNFCKGYDAALAYENSDQ
jgi:hypothetical protein